MRLKITHRTEYHYDAPVQYGLQRLRLNPASGPTQTVISWRLNIEGAHEEVNFLDQFSNETRLISIEGDPRLIVVEATGMVDTKDTAGIYGLHYGFAPLWLFCSETPLTAAGARIRALAASIEAGADVERLHALMKTIASQVVYTTGSTSAQTLAEDALALGTGVCQDHSHIFVSAARTMGFPARYVSGYLMMNDVIEQVASHAWAEAHVPGLGWVAFDASNGISPDERYVRIAIGRDYREATPVSGIRYGQAQERLAVSLMIEQ